MFTNYENLIILYEIKIIYSIVFIIALIYSNRSYFNRESMDEDIIIIYNNCALPDYSFKGYDVSPYIVGDYELPINIGDEWLVLYKKGDRKIHLEKHYITDTTQLNTEYCNLT